jgi:VanZ family protein
MKKLQPYAPAIAWGIFIFVLSVWPGKDFPKLDWGDLLSVDKLVHITFYALLTGLIVRGKMLSDNSLKTSENRAKMVRFAAITAVSCTAYGWLLEWIQDNFCQDRLFDWFDGLANTIGATLAFGVFIWRSRK